MVVSSDSFIYAHALSHNQGIKNEQKYHGASINKNGSHENYLLFALKHTMFLTFPFLIAATSSITVINKAIKQFHDFTCIKWVTTSDPLFNPTALGHQNVVTFINAT